MKIIRKALIALPIIAGYAGLAFACHGLHRPAEQWLYIVLALLSAMTLPFSGKKPMALLRGLVGDLLILALVLPMGLTAVLYEGNFLHHQTTPPEAVRQQQLSGSIHVLDSPFTSNLGQRLFGQLYYQGDSIPDTVVIVSHGNGIGHTGYANVIDFFARNGFAVFAYDATGYDESQGFSTRGLPQGIIDLDHAILHVRQDPLTAGKPIVLFGHSWGGYSACSVLNVQPEVEAVITLAGFNDSLQIIGHQGRQLIGSAINVLLPHFSLYERLKFGKYASLSALDGFSNSRARIMIVHSSDDETVPIQYGLALYRSKYEGDGRFLFVEYSDRGHEGLFSSSEAGQYLDFIRGQA